MKHAFVAGGACLVVGVASFFAVRELRTVEPHEPQIEEASLIPEAFRPPEPPTRDAFINAADGDAPDRFADAVMDAAEALVPSLDHRASLAQGARSSLALLAAGDYETYRAYREAFLCALGPTAEPLADQRYRIDPIPEIGQREWEAMNAEEKFAAIASRPDARNASILRIAAEHARFGLGERSTLPIGYRTQGLMSAYRPPTAGLFALGSDPEWAWVEVPVTIAETDQALLRFEYVRDPSVDAWILQRGSLLAPKSVNLPWIVF